MPCTAPKDQSIHEASNTAPFDRSLYAAHSPVNEWLNTTVKAHFEEFSLQLASNVAHASPADLCNLALPQTTQAAYMLIE